MAESKLRKIWKSLGPGLVAGASGDDPSGIVTYSIAGAKFGLSVLWTAIFTLPFMIVIQKMAGRIGLISGKGIAGNMKKHYPPFMLITVALIAVVASIVNIGANISGMAAAFTLLIPISPILYSVILVTVLVASLIMIPYYKLASYMKWIAIALFSYVIAAFLVQHDWSDILRRTFIPGIHLSKDYLLMIVAILGTTISPYLFFWQASGQVEEERIHTNELLPSVHPHHPKHRSDWIVGKEIGVMNRDIKSGMFFSNLITYFIIITSATTLFNNGFNNVQTIEEIASVLKPLAGHYANLLFLIGITVAGILSIPILAGSAAYVLAETFGWKDGLGHKFIIAGATVLGVMVPLMGFDPIKAMFYTAVLYGLTAPFLIFAIIHMANNPKVVGDFTNRTYSNIMGYILFVIMAIAVLSLLFL